MTRNSVSINKVNVFLSFLFLCIALNSSAQEFDFSFQTGVGFYKMNDLKALTTQGINQHGFQAKIVYNYPPSLYIQPSITFRIRGISLGFVYSYQSTGSRISAIDNSNKSFDTKINCHAPGIILGFHPENDGKMRMSFYGKLGRAYSNLSMNGSQPLNESYKFDSRCLYYEPGLQISYNIKKNYVVGFNAGYFKEFKRQDFELKGARGTLIKTNHDSYIGNGWDGLRLGLLFTYRLFTAK